GGDEPAERHVVTHGEVGQDLAVDGDLGGLQTGDEPGVRDVVLAARRVDAHDPELAELALARASVAVRVVPAVHDLLVRLADAAAPRTAVALGPLEDGAPVLLPVDRPLDPGHRTCSLVCLSSTSEHALDVALRAAGDLCRPTEPARALARLLLEQVRPE